MSNQGFEVTPVKEEGASLFAKIGGGLVVALLLGGIIYGSQSLMSGREDNYLEKVEQMKKEREAAKQKQAPVSEVLIDKTEK